ncbi:hypothetical protein TNCV_3094411 [Trichonephila clavipes]|nr:hypothetical protein TNCV_3094411 [Trichonephila clavipes]
MKENLALKRLVHGRLGQSRLGWRVPYSLLRLSAGILGESTSRNSADVPNYGVISTLHGIPYILEDPWHVTYPLGSYRYSSDEVFN